MKIIVRKTKDIITYLDTSDMLIHKISSTANLEYTSPKINKTLKTLTGISFIGVDRLLVEIQIDAEKLDLKLNLSDYYTDIFLFGLTESYSYNLSFTLDDRTNVYRLPYFILGREYFNITSMSDKKADLVYNALIIGSIDNKAYFSCIHDSEQRKARVKSFYITNKNRRQK